MGVFPGLYTILLGREWIRAANLLTDINNKVYYIPVALTIKSVAERLLAIDEGEEDENYIGLDGGGDAFDGKFNNFSDVDDSLLGGDLLLKSNYSSDGEFSYSDE